MLNSQRERDRDRQKDIKRYRESIEIDNLSMTESEI